jgi:hypothetical protein
MIHRQGRTVQTFIIAATVVLSAGCAERATPRAPESTAAVAETAASASSVTAAAVAPAVDSTPGPIPPAFRGTWDASAGRCGLASSEMRLVVGADSLHYYEGTGAVLRVAPLVSDGGQIIRVETRHQAEGMVEPRTQTLARRGDSLWVKFGTDSTARVRCTAVAR